LSCINLEALYDRVTTWMILGHPTNWFFIGWFHFHIILFYWTNSRRKIEINDSINNSVFSHLRHKLLVNNSNNVFGFELLWMSHLCHLSCLCTRGYISSKGWLRSLSQALLVWTMTWLRQSCPCLLTWWQKKVVGPSGNCCTTKKKLLFSDLGDMWLFVGALPWMIYCIFSSKIINLLIHLPYFHP
jgi:hypothetical protein